MKLILTFVIILMKVHLVKIQTIVDYSTINAQAKKSLAEWISKIRWADWNTPNDIKTTFGYVDFLGNGSDRIVFNIGGNKYRLICKYFFGELKVHLYIKWIGTHADYTKLCDAQEQFSIDIY